MKKIIYLTILIFSILSCDNEPVDFNPNIDNDYSIALDTLVNYDNYFIGKFNGEILVSTEPFTSGRSVNNTLQDSVSLRFDFAYKISNSEELKTPFINFIAYESINKLNSNNYFKYNEYNDFYTFFNRTRLEYWNVDNYKNLTTQVLINYIDYSQLINNTGISYIKKYNRFRVRISVDGVTYGLGSYETIEEALEARKDGELKYLGRILNT